jgi:hypothetical protein
MTSIDPTWLPVKETNIEISPNVFVCIEICHGYTRHMSLDGMGGFQDSRMSDVPT